MTNDTLISKISNMPNTALAMLVTMLAAFLPSDKHLVFVEVPAECTRKIMLIRLVRTVTGTGLKESKDFVEQYGFLMVDEQQARILQDVYATMGGVVKDFNNKPPF